MGNTSVKREAYALQLRNTKKKEELQKRRSAALTNETFPESVIQRLSKEDPVFTSPSATLVYFQEYG